MQREIRWMQLRTQSARFLPWCGGIGGRRCPQNIKRRDCLRPRVQTISGTGFDRLARHYYWMECVLAGRTLQKCRTAFLDQTRDARRALLLGEGNGRFLIEFLKANKKASVVCVDASSRMLKLAARRAGGLAAGRARFVKADLLESLN